MHVNQSHESRHTGAEKNKRRAAEKEVMRIKCSNILILPFVNLNFKENSLSSESLNKEMK